MCYKDTVIKDYSEMVIPDIIREFLTFKGTWVRSSDENRTPIPINRIVHPKELVSSGLFVYGLIDNQTNKRAIEYYCERWGRLNRIIDENGYIHIPLKLWKECDEKNKEFINSRKEIAL